MKAQTGYGGYSLIELLVALGLLTTLIAWAVPTLTDIVHGASVKSGALALTSSLALARSEAVKRNTRVVMCKSASGSACEAGSDWRQGWIVFHDVNNNGVLDSLEQVLHREGPLPSVLRLTVNTPVSHYVSYNPYGRTKLTSGAFQAGTFTVCAHSGSRVQARQVVINSGGRVRVASAGHAQCA